MALDIARDSSPMYENEQLKKLAEELMPMFEDRVYGLISEIAMTHEFVGYVHFRDRVLAPNIGRVLGRYLATVIIDKMIEQGKLETGKFESEGREYPTATLGKVNVPELST